MAHRSVVKGQGVLVVDAAIAEAGVANNPAVVQRGDAEGAIPDAANRTAEVVLDGDPVQPQRARRAGSAAHAVGDEPLERVFKLPEVIKNATPPPSWFSSQGRRSRSDERAVSQRSDGWTMASVAGSAAEAVDTWQTADLSAADPECDLVRQSNWVSVASAAA